MTDVLNKIMGGLVAAAGLGSLVGAVWGLSHHLEVEAAKAAAREAGAPALVRVERFRPGRHVGPAGEVALQGRMRFAETLVAPSPYTGWIAPLYPAEGGAEARPIAFAVAPAEQTGRAPGQAPLAGLELLDGAAGAERLVALSGRRVDPSLHADALKKARREHFGADPPGPDRPLYLFEPFADGREAALRPARGDFLLRAAFLAVALGMVGLGGWMLARRPDV